MHPGGLAVLLDEDVGTLLFQSLGVLADLKT